MLETVKGTNCEVTIDTFRDPVGRVAGVVATSIASQNKALAHTTLLVDSPVTVKISLGSAQRSVEDVETIIEALRTHLMAAIAAHDKAVNAHDDQLNH